MLIPFARLDPGLGHDPGRLAAWRESYGDERCPVPIVSDEPFYARLPIGLKLVYELDLGALLPETIRRMAAVDAARHGLAVDEAERQIRAEGMVILAIGVEVIHIDTADLAAIPSPGEGGAPCP